MLDKKIANRIPAFLLMPGCLRWIFGIGRSSKNSSLFGAAMISQNKIKIHITFYQHCKRSNLTPGLKQKGISK